MPRDMKNTKIFLKKQLIIKTVVKNPYIFDCPVLILTTLENFAFREL